MKPEATLRIIRTVHTLVWAVFAGAIVATPVFVYRQNLTVAWFLIGIVFVEVMVLLVNRMRCPLTGVAARYTENRQDNFDIYLPLWLARYNKLLFGVLYLAGVAYAVQALL